MPSFTAAQKLGVQPTVTPQYLETARAKDESGKQRIADSLLAEEIAKKDKDFATMWAKRKAGGDEAATGLLNYYTYGDPNYGQQQQQQAQYQFSQGDAAGYFNNPDEILKQLNYQSPETRIPGAFSLEGQQKQFSESPVMASVSAPLKVGANAVLGVGNMIKGLGSAVANPADTMAGLSRGVAGAAELGFEKLTGKQVPEFNTDGTTTQVADTQNQKVAKGIWDELVMKRYGSLDAAKKTMFEDPVGVLADVLTIAGGVGAAKNLVTAGRAGETSRALSVAGEVGKASETANVAEKGSAIGTLGKVMKAPFKGAKKVGEGAEAAKEGILGYATGAGRNAIAADKNIYRYGSKEAMDAINEGLRAGSVNEANALSDVVKNLEVGRDIRAEQYRAKLSALAQSTDPLDGTPISKALAEQAKRFKLQRTPDGSWDFSVTDFPAGSQEAEEITRYMNEIFSWGNKEGKAMGQNMDVLGLDTLKKRLDSIFPETPRGKAFATPVQNALEGVLNKVPGYKEMTTEYADFTAALNDVKQTLSVGGKAAKDTAIRKLTNLLKNNHENKLDTLNALLERTGDTTTIPKLVGVSMSSLTPRGISGLLQSVNVLNAKDLARLGGRLSSVIISSPRVVHEFLKVQGLSQRQIDKIIEFGRKAGLGKAFSDEVVGIGGQVGRVNEAAKKKEQVDKLFPTDAGQNE